MNKAVPWSIKGVDFDAREAAKEAARRSGMSLGEWLNSIISDQAAELGVDVEDIDDSDRLEAVTARLAQMSKRGARSVRRDDRGDDSDAVRRRRPAAAARDRYEARDYAGERDVPRGYDRERPSGRDAEIMLDDAVRVLERGARRSSERTAEAISQVARRLEDIESHIGAGRGAAPPPQQDAIARLEARLDALARRRNPDSAEASLRELERKIAAMSDNGEAKPRLADQDSSPDLVRIEAKLNRLLDGVQKPAPPAKASGATMAQPPAPHPFARSTLGEAIAQITRRQQALDGAPVAPLSRPAQPVAPPIESDAPRAPAPVWQGPDLSTLQKDIATLAGSLEQTRREMQSRSEDMQRSAHAQTPGVDILRRQIDEMSRALRDLAPRDAIASIETAIRDLGQRVDNSRQVGVHETILRPIEELAADVRRSLTNLAPNGALEREVRLLASKIEAAREPGFDASALREIHAQTQEMRDLLTRAIARPAPIEKIERQIAGLGERVERLAQQGPAALGDPGLAHGIGEIRNFLDQAAPAGVFRQLEDRIDALGRKIDDAVAQSSAVDQFDELAVRIDQIQKAVSQPRPPAAPVDALDTRALEVMMRDLAGKLDRPAAADTQRLETMLQSLAERLSVAGASNSDMHLVESLHGQIARLADKVEAAGQSRADTRILEQLQTEMARFAAKAQAGSAGVDPRFAEALQQQLTHLTQRLDQGDASARVLQSLESTIGELFHRIDDMRSAAVDAAEAAARNAARATVIETMQNQPALTSSAPSESLTRELADLRTMQDNADRRTHATLTAVHETLEKVVDRLAVLEDDLAVVSPEPYASGPAPVFARSGPAPEPPMKQPAREVEIPRPQQAQSPALSLDAPLDELIEPGSGVAPGRRGPSPQPDAEPARPAEPSTQSSFIAAARRAAQAASGGAAAQEKPERSGGLLDNALSSARDRAKAAHMAIAGGERPSANQPAPSGGGGKLAKLKGFVAARKRLVLIALIGVVAVAASMQMMRFLRGPSARPEVVDLTGQKTSQRAAPAAQPPETATQSLTQAPADLSGASKFVTGAGGPSVDATPTGSINGKPAAPLQATLNLHDAAASGNTAAQYELAVRYADGRTVGRDTAIAAQWFEKAARQNHAPAQYRLGAQYERGIGVARDAKRAREWYQRAAEAGNIRAMHNLAVLAAEGVDGKPDYATAASWFRKAAEYGVRDSQYNFAILLARGLGVEQNLTQSWAWFSLASAQGDADAGKKRADVATKLDARALAAASAIVDGFKVRPTDKAANEAPPPPEGWDGPSQAAPRPAANPAPAAKSPAKGKVTSL